MIYLELKIDILDIDIWSCLFILIYEKDYHTCY